MAVFTHSPLGFAANPSFAPKTVPEFIAYAKANPGKLNFAISGIGGAPHLAGIEFALRTGVQATPTVIIAGKYSASMTGDRGPAGLVETIDWLVQKERAEAARR